MKTLITIASAIFFVLGLVMVTRDTDSTWIPIIGAFLIFAGGFLFADVYNKETINENR